jgi:hypothetical protein
MEEVGIFYGRYIYFTDIWYNIWPNFAPGG